MKSGGLLWIATFTAMNADAHRNENASANGV
jgi:hypothetical protein